MDWASSSQSVPFSHTFHLKTAGSKKCLKVRQKLGTRNVIKNLKTLKTWKFENFEKVKNDPWDMLNNFCFHVYAQTSLFIGVNVNGFF